jgi:hypothetical protein
MNLKIFFIYPIHLNLINKYYRLIHMNGPGTGNLYFY